MEPGRVIAGKYRLNELLGMGGMATVWSATNVFTERAFAVKFLHAAMEQTAEVSRRFLMEAKASARINHPNIIEIIDVGQAEDGSLFLVMELLTGISLEGLMQRQESRMRLYDFCGVMLDVARALSAAHANGVIHRDLKPTNIFLHQDRHGVVPKLLDFGISKFLLDDSAEALTLTGTILGSPNYMSPEQAQGARRIDGRTDIFAFGTILFEALVGYRCFDANNFNALLIAVATKQPRSIDACAPHLPEPLRELIRGCLVTDRKRRISTIEEVIGRLEHVMPHLEQDPACIAPPLQHLPPAAPASARPEGAEAPPRSGVTPNNRARTTSKTRATRRMGQYIIAFGAVLMAMLFIITYAAWRPPPKAKSPPKMPMAENVAAAAPPPPRPKETSPANGPAPSAPPTLSAPPMATMDRFGMAPPVVNVDSLPSAERPDRTERAPARPPRRGERSERGKKDPSGHLQIAAIDETCTVFVDDARRGTTPLTIDVPPGPHRLRCEVEGSEPKTGEVTISSGGTTMYTFRFD